MTHSVEIFLAAHEAIAAGVAHDPAERQRQGYFPQDWFADRIGSLGLPLHPQGRNSYPDFWVGDDARPPGRGLRDQVACLQQRQAGAEGLRLQQHHPVRAQGWPRLFLVFFLYTGSGANPRPVHSLCIAHGDLINADHDVAAAHVNEGIEGFGSYGDGFIRDRKMYRFPQPFTLDPAGIGRCRLILPAEWAVSDSALDPGGDPGADRSSRHPLESYSIYLDGKTRPTTAWQPAPDAGQSALPGLRASPDRDQRPQNRDAWTGTAAAVPARPTGGSSCPA